MAMMPPPPPSVTGIPPGIPPRPARGSPRPGTGRAARPCETACPEPTPERCGRNLHGRRLRPLRVTISRQARARARRRGESCVLQVAPADEEEPRRGRRRTRSRLPPRTRPGSRRSERPGPAVPVATASFVVVTAIVERIAMPTAPPICCDVLMRPDARPASCGFVPATAAIVTATNANGIPRPMMRKPGKRSVQYEPSTDTCVK